MKTAGTLRLTTPTDTEIVMTREFNAPRTLVFDAHTKPELVRRWLLGPDGWTMPVCEIDLRVGGAYRYVWRKDGEEMGMGGVFKEIAAPERLVATEKFDQAWYPGECLVTTVLTEKNGRTLLEQTSRFDTRAARDTALKSGMESGIAASCDRLERIMEEILAGA
jgi:uncharacterized protein YndB with AHSA1/START domain